ncbi:MAG: hypothetical protein KAI79_09840 [Bacteroidales bacterium]|nr:hypothetical protein [Bacteroidales bacterium]
MILIIKEKEMSLKKFNKINERLKKVIAKHDFNHYSARYNEGVGHFKVNEQLKGLLKLSKH